MQTSNVRPFIRQSTITKQGQTTVPAEIRAVLGIKAGDTVAFVADAQGVHLQPAAFTLASTAGSVAPLHRPEDYNRVIHEAKEVHAERSQRKLNMKI